VKFWDSSAIVPLLLEQRHSPRVAQLFQSDPELLVWWGTRVECVCAIARLEREGNLATVGMSTALDRLKQFAEIWDEVQPTPRLRGNAERLLRVHELRAADAFQLAAMVEVGAEEPGSFEIVCFDERLSRAALREGFRVTATGG
jgi:predicted nucleic acid-binding protein